MTLIVAGSFQEYRKWMKARNLSIPNQFYRYVSGRESLLGARPDRILFTGTWTYRKDAARVEADILKLKAMFPQIEVIL